MWQLPKAVTGVHKINVPPPERHNDRCKIRPPAPPHQRWRRGRRPGEKGTFFRGPKALLRVPLNLAEGERGAPSQAARTSRGDVFLRTPVSQRRARSPANVPPSPLRRSGSAAAAAPRRPARLSGSARPGRGATAPTALRTKNWSGTSPSSFFCGFNAVGAVAPPPRDRAAGPWILPACKPETGGSIPAPARGRGPYGNAGGPLKTGSFGPGPRNPPF